MQKEYLNLADKLVDDNLTIYFDTENDKVYIVQSVDGQIKEDIIHDFKKTSVEKGSFTHRIVDENRKKVLKVYNIKDMLHYEVISMEEEKIKEVEPDTYQPYFVLATMISLIIFLSGEPITQYTFTEFLFFNVISCFCTYGLYRLVNASKRKKLEKLLGSKEKLHEYDKKQKSTTTYGCLFTGYMGVLLITYIIIYIHIYIFNNQEMSLNTFRFFIWLYLPFGICCILFIPGMYIMTFASSNLFGCGGILVLFLGTLSYFVKLTSDMQVDYYFHTKRQLTETPFHFPDNIMNSSGEVFIDAAHNYGNTKQRCFYFDLQWSIRHSKNQGEREKYQSLEKRFLQSENRSHDHQILAYKLHEALLADASRDSILHYFKELHPGNIYNTDIYFERISRTINLVTATPEQEREIASGSRNGGRRYGFGPRPLSQAIVNSSCFNMDEKIIMIEYLINCYMELAIHNKCPENYIQEFKTEIFDKTKGDYHISNVKDSAWCGTSYIEDKINQLMQQMKKSNPNWYTIYTPENWEEFSL